MKRYFWGMGLMLLILTFCICGCTAKEKDMQKVNNEIQQNEKQTDAIQQGSEAEQSDGVIETEQSAGNIETEQSAESSKTLKQALTKEPADTDKYIEVAINVFYNDAENAYYKNESGSSIFITEEGQYELSFDCDTNLSEEAKAAGVNSLKNLTAIYLLDMGVGKGKQSPIKSCNIVYDAVIADGKELTVNAASPKSAIKSSGIFDTNDPINGWDGSAVEEVTTDTAAHVANFSSVTSPKSIVIRFTLSDMDWDGTAEEEDAADSVEGENKAVFSKLDLQNMDALTVSKYLGNGINLGNTMEAYGKSTLGVNAPVKSYETFWGQPVTTPEMFLGMKACGFDTVRIPIAWTNTMDYENGDYTISEAFLDRVEEIVNYALDAEMFVIINDHWDGGWWSRFGSSTPETVQGAYDIYSAMWKQISERFRDYSHMLIFESANEELGSSLNNNSNWPDTGHLTRDRIYELTNKINQTFVDVVRSTGGDNADRFLLIAGYDTSIDYTTDSRYKMPQDVIKGKLLVSVHYYTPWNYCGNDKQARWGLKKEIEEMNRELSRMTKFTDAGYGVIIGEYGALPLFDSETEIYELKENTMEFTTNLLDNCDIYNYVPVLWATNDFFNKKTCTMFNEELTQLFTSRRYEIEAQQAEEYIEKVNKHRDDFLSDAIEMWNGVQTYADETPVAWIMWNGGAGTYSVGDTFNPADNTAGIIATNTIINGAGEYTVSLDFENGNDGLTFAALAVANGEVLYPKNVILIEELTIDGKPANMIASPYTCSDDGICTRVNIINEWVSTLPADARSMQGLSNAGAVILDKNDLVGIHNITIKFRLFER